MNIKEKLARETALRCVLLGMILLLNAVITVLLTEGVWRSSLSEGIYWLMTRYRFSLWNIAVIFSLSLLLTLLMRRLSLSMLMTNALAALASVIHYFKMDLRGEPLLLTDIDQAETAMQVIGAYQLDLPTSKLLFVLIMVLLPAVLCIGVRLRKTHLKRRAASCLLGAALLCFSVVQTAGLYKTINVIIYNMYVDEAGLVAGIIGSYPKKLEKPSDYSAQTVKDALGPVQRTAGSPEMKPDILFVMLESFYDPTKIPGVNVEGDLLVNMRSLQQEGWGGELIVPKFGGGTGQIEYEVMTGYRGSDTDGNAYLTAGIMREGMESIVSLLQEHGYFTQTMHPSTKTAYGRDKAYARLGFDSSLFIGDMSEVDAFYGTTPADSWFLPEVLAQYDKYRTEQPYFAYIVTFQNHGGYLDKTVPWVVPVSGPTGDYLTSANNYVNGLYMTDQALPLLFDVLRERERPTLVVMYGDHSPAWSSFGIVGNDALDFAAHTTPLLIWSNYGFEVPEDTPDMISSYRLGALVMDMLGFGSDAYFSSLRDAPDLYYKQGYIVEEGELASDTERYAQEDARLKLLHYDRLNGSNYTKQISGGQ